MATSCSLIMVCPHLGQVMPRCWRAWLAGMGCVLCPQWSHFGVMVVMSAVHVAWAPHLGQVMVCPGVAVFWSCLACWLVGWYPQTVHVGVMMVVLMVLLFMVVLLGSCCVWVWCLYDTVVGARGGGDAGFAYVCVAGYGCVFLFVGFVGAG